MKQEPAASILYMQTPKGVTVERELAGYRGPANVGCTITVPSARVTRRRYLIGGIQLFLLIPFFLLYIAMLPMVAVLVRDGSFWNAALLTLLTAIFGFFLRGGVTVWARGLFRRRRLFIKDGMVTLQGRYSIPLALIEGVHLSGDGNLVDLQASWRTHVLDSDATESLRSDVTKGVLLDGLHRKQAEFVHRELETAIASDVMILQDSSGLLHTPLTKETNLSEWSESYGTTNTRLTSLGSFAVFIVAPALLATGFAGTSTFALYVAGFLLICAFLSPRRLNLTEITHCHLEDDWVRTELVCQTLGRRMPQWTIKVHRSNGDIDPIRSSPFYEVIVLRLNQLHSLKQDT